MYKFLHIIGIIDIISFLSGVDLNEPYWWLTEDKRQILSLQSNANTHTQAESKTIVLLSTRA